MLRFSIAAFIFSLLPTPHAFSSHTKRGYVPVGDESSLPKAFARVSSLSPRTLHISPSGILVAEKSWSEARGKLKDLRKHKDQVGLVIDLATLAASKGNPAAIHFLYDVARGGWKQFKTLNVRDQEFQKWYKKNAREIKQKWKNVKKMGRKLESTDESKKDR